MAEKLGDGRILAAVETIYASALAPAEWPYALQTIADCFDDVGALLIYQRDDGSFGTIVSPSLESAQRDYEQNEWWRHDVRFMRSVERGYLAGGDTVTERHVISDEELATFPFYQDFLASHGLRWFAGTPLSPEPRVAVALAAQRAMTKPPYTNDELALATRLGRHVETALRIGIRLVNAEVANLALGDALARLGVGVFLLDQIGRVTFSNPAAEQLIGDGLVLAQQRLTARFAPEREALRARLATVLDGKPESTSENPRPILLHGRQSDRFLAVYVLPVRLPSGHAVEHIMAGVRAIVVVMASATDAPADPTVVRDLLDLTLSEARIAALIGAGLPPRDAAERLGISEETARTVLKRVFSKVGVSRQSELAALLTKLVLR